MGSRLSSTRSEFVCVRHLAKSIQKLLLREVLAKLFSKSVQRIDILRENTPQSLVEGEASAAWVTSPSQWCNESTNQHRTRTTTDTLLYSVMSFNVFATRDQPNRSCRDREARTFEGSPQEVQRLEFSDADLAASQTGKWKPDAPTQRRTAKNAPSWQGTPSQPRRSSTRRGPGRPWPPRSRRNSR